MASSEWEKDDMGSLFEGMVLFNPPQVAADEYDRQHQSVTPPPTNGSISAAQPLDESLFSDLTVMAPLQSVVGVQAQSDPSPATSGTIATTTTSTSVSSSAPAAAASTTAGRQVLPSLVSRQLSTRKKKRAGLRIGYGRDAPILVDDQSISVKSGLPGGSSPLPSSATEIGSRRGATFQEEEEKEKGEKQNRVQVDKEEEDEEEVEEEEEGPSSSTCFASPHVQPDSHLSRISTMEAKLTTTKTALENASSGIDDDDSSHTRIDNGNGSLCRPDKSIPDAGDNTREDNEGKHLSAISSPIELRFEQITAQISEKLKHARDLVTSVSATRKASIRRRRKDAENVSLASTKYRELEKELEEACEAEDFETAESVSESLASAEKEKELFAIALRDAEADSDAIDSKMQEVLEFQIATEEECASLFQRFAMDAASNADLVLKNAKEMSSNEMDKWLSSTEALEVKKMELEIELHLVNEARFLLNDSIEHSAEDDMRERELLCKKNEALTEELENLLALVQKKKREIAENNANIEKVDKRIDDVISSFQVAKSSTDTNYNRLLSGLSQIELDNNALSRKKNEIDNFLSQEEGRGANIRELARLSADEAEMYQEVVGLRRSLMQFILKSREDKVRLAKSEEKLSEDVQMLRHVVAAARASLQELSSSKSGIQQEIESFKQRLLFIDKRVPELEAEKKVAATARNFKEAARIATEAKTLCVEKEAVQIKMEEAMLELGKLEEEIGKTVGRMEVTEVQILSKEKELAMARFQRLLLIAGTATAERSAAVELGDLEEADTLLAEAEAADSEARKLQPVYGFKEEEFTNLPKHFISMELVSNLGRKQLAELVVSAHVSAL